jgi:meso-butanediol dehydrogenase/(S,S)-butanediol dehydrogenase/diacetyl reductase
MDLKLEDKVALVTGGGRGIGKAIVEAFAGEGSQVIVADILEDEAEQVTREVASLTKAIAVKVNVTRKADVDAMVQTALGEFGRIDILVNAAGVIGCAPLVDIEENEWDRVMDVNAKGTYLVSRAVVPHMMKKRYGKIVNISSRSGKAAQALFSHYGASKFAVLGLTQAMARELAEYDINVNAICPGTLRTDMYEKILDARCRISGLPREEIFASVIATIPLGRPQLPEDVARVAVLLSSELARNITGESININGGQQMD